MKINRDRRKSKHREKDRARFLVVLYLNSSDSTLAWFDLDPINTIPLAPHRLATATFVPITIVQKKKKEIQISILIQPRVDAGVFVFREPISVKPCVRTHLKSVTSRINESMNFYGV